MKSIKRILLLLGVISIIGTESVVYAQQAASSVKEDIVYWLVGDKMMTGLYDELKGGYNEVESNIRHISYKRPDKRIVVELRDGEGKPISNFKISLYYFDADLPPRGWGSKGAITDSNGHCAFINPPEETYMVCIGELGSKNYFRFSVAEPNTKLDVANNYIPPGTYIVTMGPSAP